jgi:RimJ/RimL family protein N-acetyltransferase
LSNGELPTEGNWRFFRPPPTVTLPNGPVVEFRPLAVDDVQAYLNYINPERNPDFGLYDPFFSDPDNISPEGAANGISRVAALISQGHSLSCAGWHDGRIVARAACGFSPTPRFARMGTNVDVHYRGQQLTQRIQSWQLGVAFGQLHVEVAWLHVDPRNDAAVTVAGQFGYREAGDGIPPELASTEIPEGQIRMILRREDFQPPF